MPGGASRRARPPADWVVSTEPPYGSLLIAEPGLERTVGPMTTSPEEKQPPGPVIVGVDASDRSTDAVVLGSRIAELTGAPLLLVAVYPVDALPSRFSQAGYFEELRKDAQATLDRALSHTGADHAQTRTIGDPSTGHALHELAAREHASLICVGPSHRGRIGRGLLGGTGERLLHGAPCPVAMAPRGYAERPASPLRSVGCGFHNAAESAAALKLAASLALRAHARLRVIEAVQPLIASAPVGATIDYRGLMADQVDWRRKAVAEAVRSLPAGLEVDVKVEEDYATHLLREQSEQLDLLVLGSRGYGPLHAVVVGAVSTVLMRESQCPVIVAPRRAGSADPSPGDRQQDHLAPIGS